MSFSRFTSTRGALYGLALGLALTSASSVAQEPLPPGTTAPGAQQQQDATPTATISNTDDSKKQKKSREQKRDEKTSQSKATKKDLERLKKENPLAGVNSTQPDKQLYDKALLSMKKGKFDMARLELQTLLATYPDSEYQMRAKLAFADSWYKEGGSSALTQAEAEYKDFITFFPNAPEAAEAQLRVGDIYFKQMDTPDRDDSKAIHAQEEYRTMLEQFPDSPLTNQARQRLREVQEVLATREAETAAFYATRENWPASIARYQTVVDTYPLYSHADEALIGLGDAYATEARNIRMLRLPEGAKAKLIKIYEDNAADAYDRVVTQYAAAPHVEDARDRLETLGRPIPTPTPEQLAASQALENSRSTYRLKDRVKLLVLRGPDTVNVAHVGQPSLTDPKRTIAPAISREAEENFRAALNPNAHPETAAAPAAPADQPAADASAPADSAPAAAPANAAPLALQDVPAADAPASTGAAAFNPNSPAATTPTGGSTGGNSVGVEILSSGATAKPANNTALPPVEGPETAPDQINDVAGQKTPAAEAAPADGKKAKAEYDSSEASSSKHKRKKGIKKVNPF